MSDSTVPSGVVEADARHDCIRHVGRRQSFSPYPKYKPSGVEWLGDVPEHWEMLPIKRGLTSVPASGALIKGAMATEARDGLFPGFSASGQDVWTEYAQYRQPGLVLSAVGARCGKTFKADGAWTAIANTHAFLVPDGHCRDYMWFVTNRKHFWLKGGAAQPYVQIFDTLQRVWAFPPLGEQLTIAAYLDRETAKIDALIARNEVLIERLKEQRASLISRTVTRGLPPDESRKADIDPNPKLKPSGVEWLGGVPEHWEIDALCRVTTDIRASNVDKHFRSTEIAVKVCNYVNVYYNESIDTQINYMHGSATRRQIDFFQLREGDVLITKDSEAQDDIGVPALVTEHVPNLVAGYHLVLVRPDLQCLYGPYLFRALQSDIASLQFTHCAQGVTRYGMTYSGIRSVRLPIPPLTEQRAIAAYLDRETAKIDRATNFVRQESSLLREYRTSLISDLVTGKVDIRRIGSEP